MKLVSSTLIAASLLGLSAQAEEVPTLSPADLSLAAGTDWTGELTYMNYQAPFEDVTIPASLEVDATESGLRLAYIYPDEPHANSTVVAKVSGDGTMLMGEPIISNQVISPGAREVKTAFPCQDMGKSATCEMTYLFGVSKLKISKMVTYDGETEAFRRNAYFFSR